MSLISSIILSLLIVQYFFLILIINKCQACSFPLLCFGSIIPSIPSKSFWLSVDKNLPFIYGEFDIDKFFEKKEDIDQSNFRLSQVKNLFFFPSGRWDIETHKGILIKLPIFKVKESLNLYLELLNKDDFKNIKIIDLRQNNQVITNE
mgnify:CR=1 FL=1